MNLPWDLLFLIEIRKMELSLNRKVLAEVAEGESSYCAPIMKTIAITGGKGGTGKSTVSILLANQLRKSGKRVVLCDCDVECPNDHLLLGLKLEEKKACPPKLEERRRVYAKFPKLNKGKCTKCGLCVKNCRSNAIFQPQGEYPIFLHELCSGCGLCWNLCPNEAIEVERKIVGEIFENKISDNFWLVAGKSVGIIEETGPIVTETRKHAAELAKRVAADYLLLDTAVGLHCGVIRALIDVDEAYAVTEPTPLGAHDLKLILELLKKLTVSAKIVLNQADLGDRKEIDTIARDYGVRIKLEIPYSKELVEAYSRGELGKMGLLRGNA